jgi:hypothetical protein
MSCYGLLFAKDFEGDQIGLRESNFEFQLKNIRTDVNVRSPLILLLLLVPFIYFTICSRLALGCLNIDLY